MKIIKLNLPWPPSINHAKGIRNNKPYPTDKMTKFKDEVAIEVRRRYPGLSLGKARLEVHIQAFPSDRRRRDLDNIQKVLLDSLQAAGLFDDDEQIDYLSILRGPRIKEAMVVVLIKEKSRPGEKQ